MPTALYYPHSIVLNPDLLKTALLLWDRVDYLKPSWYTNPEPEDKGAKELRWLADEALEVIGNPRDPTDDELEVAHNEIHELLQELDRSGYPDWLFLEWTSDLLT